jgi:glycosyltransferase involved in cell wall biosynthesis
MKKINVLYVITSLGIGGAEKLLLSYLKGLYSEKFNFYVYTLRDKPDDLKSEISAYSEVRSLGIKNKFNPLVVFKLWKAIKVVQPQIIHTHLFQPRIYTTISHFFIRKGILITHKHSIVNPRKHHFFIFLEMICILLNTKVLAISQSVKRSLHRYEFIPERRIFVLPNSIDLNEFSSIRQNKALSLQKTIILGSVGRIEKSKGLNYLLLAIVKILKRYPNTKLEIVGDGSALEDLKALSKKLKISNSVKFFGKLANPIPAYSRMSIFILPSILEGFGIVLLEAMAAGIPVIASNVDGIKEVVVDGESGILVPPKNSDAIADAVFKIIEQPQLASNLVEEGLLRAKLFDVNSHLKNLENFYYSLLGAESYQ